jgi:hypothetical protein
MPVPFVAVWSDEKRPGAAKLVRSRGIDWIWAEQPSGVPDFGSTNSHRQRDCMTRCLCQICGRDGAHLYVIPDDREIGGSHAGLWDDTGLILNAPLHDECYEYSKTICPHLQTIEPYAIVRHSHPLPIMAYTTERLALPIGVRGEGIIGREYIVEAPR